MRYVALLRGINVGGRSRVEMPRLKALFEGLGLGAVRTYINSGNVLFESRATDRTRLGRRIERAVEQEFRFPVRVLLRTAAEMDRLVNAIPRTWKNDQHMRCDVILLWPEVDSKEVLRDVPAQRGLEDLRYVPGALVWRIDRKDAGKSRVGKIIGTDLYRSLTIRNINTIRKLDELLRGEQLV
jgi:uncharacterized protein (DUF1697 family)